MRLNEENFQMRRYEGRAEVEGVWGNPQVNESIGPIDWISINKILRMEIKSAHKFP